MSEGCFHCGQEVPASDEYAIEVKGVLHPMCCPGCAAVATAIFDAGLDDYYQYRTEKGKKQNLDTIMAQLDAFDLEEVQQDFVASQGKHKSIILSVQGISCAACAWLIERHLKRFSAISRIHVNTTTNRATIHWDDSQMKLSALLGELSSIGYPSTPFQVDSNELNHAQNTKQFLYRLGIAGLATMQVMMLAVALYTGYFTDLEDEFRNYFRWISMIFATPVVLYSAQPFFFSALRALVQLRVNMDVPVSIAIFGAFVASCIATVTEQGEVYFESVSMFTFFLLLGRFLEQRARRKAAESSSNLQRLIPLTAWKLKQGEPEQVAAKSLRVGDTILVKPGDTIAADGDIVFGQTSVDESMLTGEHHHVPKNIGDSVFAGSINFDQNINVKVTKIGQQQLLNTIIRLQEEASDSKPQIAHLADKLARYFVPGLLLVATLTYLGWHFVKPEDAFWITLSVLVATCPCALSLATPAALTCGASALREKGLLVRSAKVFETLPRVDTMLFDKTGTLTKGNWRLTQCIPMDLMSEQECLRFAAALERSSSHPIAEAFKPFEDGSIYADNIEHQHGGLRGVINHKLVALGNGKFIGRQQFDQNLYLSVNGTVVASFELKDELRADAKQTIELLKSKGIDCQMLSGDPSPKAKIIADELGLSQCVHGATPAAKHQRLTTLQGQGKVVAMFGDGVNDAPVLAGANLSVAMGSGSDIAKNSADLILLGEQLGTISAGLDVANKTVGVIKQNLAWALGYNILILPLAIAGWVPPYLAAIGMSLSSLIVVANSVRLLKL